jgi:hypothetical protein
LVFWLGLVSLFLGDWELLVRFREGVGVGEGVVAVVWDGDGADVGIGTVAGLGIDTGAGVGVIVGVVVGAGVGVGVGVVVIVGADAGARVEVGVDPSTFGEAGAGFAGEMLVKRVVGVGVGKTIGKIAGSTGFETIGF